MRGRGPARIAGKVKRRDFYFLYDVESNYSNGNPDDDGAPRADLDSLRERRYLVFRDEDSNR